MTLSHKPTNHIFTIPRSMGVYLLNIRSARHAFQYFVNNLPPPLHFQIHKSAAKLASQEERCFGLSAAMPHHVRQLYRLVVVGGERVGKTAIIEQLIFGNHVIGQVKSCAEHKVCDQNYR